MKTLCTLLLSLFYSVFLIAQIDTGNFYQVPYESVLNWKFETKGPIYGTPVVSDGIVYFGSSDSVFYATDANTGKELWRYKSKGLIATTAILADEKIYFEGGNTLYALNTVGEKLWSVKLFSDSANAQQDPWDYHRSSPVLHNGVIYIGGDGGKLVGVDAQTGKETIVIQTTQQSIIRTTPVIFDGTVYFGDWHGVMHAYNLKSATKLWEYDTKSDQQYEYWANAIIGNINYADEKIYFTGRHCRVYALHYKTGEKEWVHKSSIDSWLCGGPVIKKEKIYFGSSDYHHLTALNTVSGELIWETKLDCRIWGNPLLTENNIIIGSNSLYLLSQDSGNIQAQILFPKIHPDKKFGEYIDRTANFHSSPLLHENQIIIGNDKGVLYSVKP